MARILIVDDVEVNRSLLVAYLESTGHVLDQAASGQEALKISRETPPDLVLLDIMMPEMDGYETMRQLKKEASHRYLPIILITALDDRVSKMVALDAGADEFLSKPIHQHELVIRTRNLLALGVRNEEVRQLQRFKDDTTALVVHDFKGLLTVIACNVDYVLESEGLASNERECLVDAQLGALRLGRLVQNLLEVSRLESSRLPLHRVKVTLHDLINSTMIPRRSLTQRRAVVLDVDLPTDLEIDVDLDLISRVVENIVDNALRYVPDGGRISLRGFRKGSSIRLNIGNTGPEIPTSDRSRIFEKYGQASSTNPHMNLGLGLYFCRLAVEAHGGRLELEQTTELPTIFSLEFAA